VEKKKKKKKTGSIGAHVKKTTWSLITYLYLFFFFCRFRDKGLTRFRKLFH